MAIAPSLARITSVDRDIVLDGRVGAPQRIHALHASALDGTKIDEEHLVIAVVDDIGEASLEDDHLRIGQITLEDRVLQMIAITLQCFADTVQPLWFCYVVVTMYLRRMDYLVVNSGYSVISPDT